MTAQPQMFRINPKTHDSQPIEEVEFARLGFQERRHIQEWVAKNPGILGQDLLVIGKEFSGFDRTNERLDLLAVDPDGQLVIIELKRDDTGADAHWQAIKYASYLRTATADNLVNMLSEHEKISEDEAVQKLLEHLNADDLNSLNRGQRIILASHRFAPEVTSASLWLNDEAGKDLITCVQLTPYHDLSTDSLYIQGSTIIPLPGAETYTVRIGDAPQQPTHGRRSTLGEIFKETFQRSLRHEATPFLREVGDLTISDLAAEIRPDRRSKWAGQQGSGQGRSYHLWYSTDPWSNWGVSYRFDLWRAEQPDTWEAYVSFKHNLGRLTEAITGIEVHPEQTADNEGIVVRLGTGSLDDPDFKKRLAETMRKLIEAITPIVTEYQDEANVEDA